VFRKKLAPTDLEKEIARLYSEMEGMNPDDKEYQTRLEVVIKLTALLPKKHSTFSGDALLGAGVNLGLTGLILHHEKLNVITSKAFGWIKPLSFKAHT
jgi:hypothetical protein